MYGPIYNFGCFLITIGCLGLWCLFAESNTTGIEYYFLFAFVGLISATHLMLGIGIVVKNKSAFNLFKVYLKFLYYGFPVGTYIAKKTLKYIENNNIEL